METVPTTFTQAGELTARRALKHLGRPNAVSWFQANAPAKIEESLRTTGMPAEYWQGMWTELTSVAGTA